MKTLIIVPVWGRPEITKIWAKGLKWFLTKDFDVLTILSREDEHFEENMKLVRRDFNYCFFKNKPLGQKMNAGIEYALETFEFDYIMNLGSDDLIHPSILQLFSAFLDEKKPFFGINRVFFYEKSTKKLAMCLPYVWGAGRMISRHIIEVLRNRGQFLYKETLQKSLDCNSMDTIQEKLGIKYETIDTGTFPYIVDIKTWDNLNDFNMMTRMYEIVPTEILTRYYPKIITELL